MRCEAQDGASFRPARVGTTCSSATQAACNEAARPNPTGEIGELISCHILNTNPVIFALPTANHLGAKIYDEICC